MGALIECVALDGSKCSAESQMESWGRGLEFPQVVLGKDTLQEVPFELRPK